MSYFLSLSGNLESPNATRRAAPVADDADDFEDADEGGTQEDEEEVTTGNGANGLPVPGSGPSR